MRRRVFCQSALAGLLSFPFASSAQAAASALTTIHIDNMHCANCAKKIAGWLFTVPGIVSVQTNHASGTAIITPQVQKQPSPRAMWEAVEKSGFKPVKIVGPNGEFTSKPTV